MVFVGGLSFPENIGQKDVFVKINKHSGAFYVLSRIIGGNLNYCKECLLRCSGTFAYLSVRSENLNIVFLVYVCDSGGFRSQINYFGQSFTAALRNSCFGKPFCYNKLIFQGLDKSLILV